jgi:Alw26I/Eco31I/Esp3I family type II restriction m6 adenine DNA methyltransferase
MINFSKKYDKKQFNSFLKQFLPKDFKEINNELEIDKNNNFFQKATLIGSVKSLGELAIIEVERIKSERSRITITKELFKFLELYGFSKSLVITFSEKESHYRFSLITSDLNWVSETKVKKEFSNPKRLSFLLGVGSKVHTASKHLIEQGKVKDFDDLHARFNIEIVNDEFYEHYKNLYLNLSNKLNKDKTFSNFAKKIDLEVNHFAKKLLGQVVFCYFLQKKGWLGVDKNKSFGNGDSSFLRNMFKKYEKDKKNFFNDFLEFFFYQGLNNQNESDFVKEINCRVPYIGGGLFEYYEGYDWKKETLNISNTFFSNSNNDGILDIFELYNFTVDENETIDIEISIDPEMLGRIFESLLEENIRQKRGAFYTPRLIVKDMCENSIINYLNIKLANKLSIQDISSFVLNEKFDIYQNEPIKKNAKTIDILLEEIKICDPAIGSGAFAVGIVNLISRLRVSLKDFVDRKYKNTSYYFKRDCIQNSIYGVDIDFSAVEITKLRLWLSLIVDEADYSSTEPLPHLDYKIMQGDSLVDEFYGFKFSINKDDKKQYSLNENPSEIDGLVDKLNFLQKKYINLKQFLKRKEIKTKVDKLLVKIFEKVMLGLDNFDEEKSKEFKKTYHNYSFINQKRNFFCWELFFAEVFYLKKGFDIIIANPPYEVLDSKITSANRISQLRKNSIFEPATEGQLNYFKLFLAKFLTHLNEDGVSAFIFQNSFLGDKTCTKIRKYVFDRNKLLNLVSFPERDDANKRVFKSAKMSVCIAYISKKMITDHNFKLEVWRDKEKRNGFITSFDKKFIQKDLYYRIPSTDKDGLNIYFKILKNPHILKLQSISKVFSGELDMTLHKKFFLEKKTSTHSSTILKGANIQSYYVTNETSQGKNEFLNSKAFLKENKSSRSSSYQLDRIAMQGITGVNEKYRIKSCLVKKNNFLANSTNFILKTSSDFTNNEIITYLNSNLLNWFFRIFSTNSNVNTYEVNILPIIKFSKNNKDIIKNIFNKLNENNLSDLTIILNKIVYETFELDKKEIEYINSHF